MDKHHRLIEPFSVLDVFVSGLGEIENVGGGCVRFTFYTIHHTDGVEERVVAAKIIMPIDAVPEAMLRTSKSVGIGLAMELRRVSPN
jgi:hypothetical protein